MMCSVFTRHALGLIIYNLYKNIYSYFGNRILNVCSSISNMIIIMSNFHIHIPI